MSDFNGSGAWFDEAQALLERIVTTQADVLEEAAQLCARSIAADGLVHLFGTGHSRIPVEEMFPRYGSFPGFHPIVELSMSNHFDVVGTNGQRQAMFIERVPGLAKVILDNFSFGPDDVMMVFSANGLTAVPVEVARGARQRGCKVVAVTGVEQSLSGEPDPAVGGRLLDEADIVIDLCTPEADAMVTVPEPRYACRSGLDAGLRGHRQLPEGAHRPAPRGAGPNATCHHARLRRRRRALTGPLRGRVS